MNSYDHLRLIRRHASGATFVAVSALFFLPSAATHAGWTQKAREGQIMVQLDYQRSDSYRDSSRSRTDFEFNGEYRKATLRLYAEYGLDDRLTAIGNVPLERARFSNDAGYRESSSALGDAEFGLRYRLTGLERESAISLQATVKIPLYGSSVDPAPGDNQLDLDLRVPMGWNYTAGRIPASIAISPGLRLREGSPSHELRFDLNNGYELSERWRLDLGLFVTYSLSSDWEAGDDPFRAGLNHEEVTIQSKVTHWVTPNIGPYIGYSAVVRGRNVGVSQTGLIGLWAKF
jgi:hypothetical protein